MTRYRYEIDAQNAIRVWDNENPNENDAPFFLQPDWPDATPWADKAEAQAWAEQLILSMTDETADLPGENPDQPTNPRVIAEPVEEENA
jgi:hypothetical protein